MNASTWLLDLGNSRLKLAPLQGDGGVGPVRAVSHRDGSRWLEELPSGEVACVASVAPDERRIALLAALSGRFARMHLVRTERALGGLEIAYRDPAQLGVDRFLTLLGADPGRAVLVVGVGTALTLDLRDRHGRHLGGRIAASPTLMRQALHDRAPQLPPDGGQYAELAADTAAALASGCDGAAIALVERTLAHAQRQLDERPRLLLHGGGAPALRPQLPPHAFQPDLVMAGLARWHALRIA